MKSMRRWLVAVVVVLVGGLAIFIFATWRHPLLHKMVWGPALLKYSDAAYETTKSRAAALVAAIEAYKQSRGGYPERLDDLVPAFATTIEPPIVGDGKWTYTRVSADRFQLGFFVGPIYEGDGYDSARGTWYVDR